ncbi:fungal-specific transcription factor domain-domain-containing protein [Kockovaella imperatae]|uniref:Fungal-specific transcription factor domain-domain-containing protein n=1 Tax=Kockovaella imperatae TaxID=4999 RepID=A0A1Y1UN09_9TREE|nr:fungal-specific transcription factor domain-domain-containing protein [Kockovaella imperatae]ORX39448.1 fungal-specific transcription factor domain-domain-containing protein [Kockovaella imperatae]
MTDTPPSQELDFAEISREARRIVDARRAQEVLLQTNPVAQAKNNGNSSTKGRKAIRFSRSTTGCLACRKSKVKCDETVPVCLRCVASQRECHYPADKDGGGSGGGGEQQRKRRRRISSKEDDHALGSGPGSASIQPTFPPAPPISHAVPGPPFPIPQPAPTGPSRAASGEQIHQVTRQRLPSFDIDLSNPFMFPGPSSYLDESVRDDVDEAALSGLLSLDTTVVNSPENTSRLAHLEGPHPFRFSRSPSSVNPLATPTPPITVPFGPMPFSQSSAQILPYTQPRISPTLSSSNPAFSLSDIPIQHRDIANSLLLQRRKNRSNAPTLSSNLRPNLQQNAQPISRALIIETLLSAHANDDLLYEFGPSHRFTSSRDPDMSAGGLTSAPPLPNSLDFLTDAFPSPTALLLFHNFCNNTSRILVTMGDMGPNPLLGLCTPSRLLDVTSPGAAAMRMSMLSASIVHYAYETEQIGDHLSFGSKWAQHRTDLKEMSDKFKRAAVANIVLAAGGEGSEPVDNLLAACTLLCIRDVISADTSWRDNMEFVINLTNRKGGPHVLLRPQEYSFTRRYLLETLALHDVFSHFVTGKGPSLIGGFDPWWFDSVHASNGKSEWESVERSFGVSRGMVDLIARIALLDSRKQRLGLSMKSPAKELRDAADQVHRDCQTFLKELDIWGINLCAIPNHPRVTCGDYIHKYMAIIFILADILEQPPTTPQIDKAVANVLELISEASAMRMSVMLVWPLLIAGAFCLPVRRTKVRELFDALRQDYCEDLEAARQILDEQWRGIDAGQGKRHWIDVMRSIGREVLLI